MDPGAVDGEGSREVDGRGLDRSGANLFPEVLRTEDVRSLRRRRVLGAIATGGLAGGTGCDSSGSEDVDPADRGPLEVSEFAFAAGEPSGYGEYTAQPAETYAPDETVWLYLELDGVAAEPTDGGDRVRIDLRQGVTVDGPDGQELLAQEESYGGRYAPDQLERFYVTNDVALSPSIAAGSYEVTVTFTDAVSGTEDEASGSFDVER